MKFILSVSFSLLIMGVQAQCDLVLSGRVVDEHDRTPLDFASVELVGTGRGVQAGADGYFRLEGLCSGTYTLRVGHVGCDPVERRVELKDDLVLEVKLEHHAHELHETEVKRKRPDEHVGQAGRTVDHDDMERASGRSLGEVLAAVPGVSVLNSGPNISKPMVHGLTGNRVLLLNQGVRQEDQQWGAEHAPNLDPLSSDRLTVVKGAASVQYGSDAIGGVIITEPVELPRGGGASGEVRGLGLYNGRGGGANAMVQGGLGSWRGFGWRMQGSGRYLGDSDAARYVLSNTGLREAGGSAALGYRDHRFNAGVYYSWFGRELGILRAAHIGNLTDLQSALERGDPWYIGDRTYDIDAPRQVAQHHLLKAEAGYAITEHDRLVVTYAYQADDRQEYDIRRAGRDAKPALDLYLTTHAADAVLKHWLGKHMHGRVGVNGLVQENNNIPGTGVRPLIPDYTRTTGGVFVVEHLPIGERLELEAGARLEATRLDVVKYTTENVLVRPAHNFTNTAFSVGAAWTAKDSALVRFNISSAFRPPHVSELYSEGLHHGAAAIEEGDAALASERAWKAVLDWSDRFFARRLQVNVTLHASHITDFIYLRPNGTRLTVRGAFPVFQYTATDALLYGADVNSELRLHRNWSWRVNASMVRGRDLERNEWLFQMPSDRVGSALAFQRTRAGKRASVSVEVGTDVVFQQERIPAGLDFAAPPGTYQLLTCIIAAERPLGRNSLRLGLRGNNLLNAAYRDYMDRFRYYADARGTDIVLWITYAFGGNPRDPETQ